MQTQRRTRRTSEEIRARLLEAARELFAEKGYDATTTRDICARSEVAQQQLWQNFGSKEGVFEAAVITPMADVINRYVEAFNSTQQNSTYQERVSVFVNGLYDLAVEYREILLLSISRRSPSTDPVATPSTLPDHIARTLHSLDLIAEPPPGMDIPATIVTTAGMIFGSVLLEEMLYPAGAPPLARDRLTKEMISTILQKLPETSS